MRSSELPVPSDRSEHPVPRLSKKTSRPIPASLESMVSKAGRSHISSTLETKPGTKRMSIGPSPATW